MSKKARDAKRLRRKMMSVWHEKEFQKELQQTLTNLITFGCTGVVTDKNGKKRAATTEEIKEAIMNCEIIREEKEVPLESLYKKYIPNIVRYESKKDYRLERQVSR